MEKAVFQRQGHDLYQTINTADGAHPSEPLSTAERRLWFLHAAAAEGAADHLTALFEISGPIDPDALETRLAAVMDRRPSLRTAFGRGGKQVGPARKIHMAVHDLCDTPADTRYARAAAVVEETQRSPFELAEGRTSRAALIRLGQELSQFVLVVHAIACDTVSLEIIIDDLLADAAAPLPVTGPGRSGRPSASVTAYAARMAGGAFGTLLPPSRSRPPVRTSRSQALRRRLSSSDVAQLRAAAEESGASLRAALIAVVKLALARHTGDTAIVVGLQPRRSEGDGTFGRLRDTLLIRTEVTPELDGTSLLRRVQDTLDEVRTFEDLTFAELVEATASTRDPSLAPLRQIELRVEEDAVRDLPHRCNGASWQRLAFHNPDIAVDLAFDSEVRADGTADLTLRYNADLFEPARMDRLIDHVARLSLELPRAPGTAIGSLPMLGAEELALLESFAGAPHPPTSFATVQAMFEAQAAATPDTPALFHAGVRLTYAELNGQANRLAHTLVAQGLRPGARVGVRLPRDPRLIVALLATLKAGCAYVPLDPSYPLSRLDFMIADADLTLVLSLSADRDQLASSPAPVLAIDQIDWAADASDPPATVGSRDLSHVIYTSGSTGRPKGVMIEHGCVVALLQWSHDQFSGDALHGVLASTSICFDLSVFEIFAPLTCGGAVHLTENVLVLPQCPTRDMVTLVNTVPSAMAELLAHSGLPPSVQVVALAGEPLSLDLVRRVQEQTGTRSVYNLYGPSEDTTYSTCASMPNPVQEAPTLGFPLPGKTVRILDSRMQPLPVGAVGEIYISGVGLARGYHGRPELTAASFPEDSSGGGGRMYRTGDLGRFTSDGRIVYAGRRDHQVKVHGYRIELGEIEGVLRSHAAVSDCVAVLRDDAGHRSLVAYATVAQPVEAADLRAHLAAALPAFMIPNALVLLAELPLTPNGKVDRAGLPPPPSAATPASAPTRLSGVERDVERIWAELLRLEHVGLDQNFFEIGGHSMLLLQLHARLTAVAGRDFEIIELFRRPTIRAQLSLVAPQGGASDRLGGDDGAFEDIAQRMRRKRAALTTRRQQHDQARG